MKRITPDMWPPPPLKPGEVYVIKMRNKKTGWVMGEWGSTAALIRDVGTRLCNHTWEVIPVVRRAKRGESTKT